MIFERVDRQHIVTPNESISTHNMIELARDISIIHFATKLKHFLIVKGFQSRIFDISYRFRETLKGVPLRLRDGVDVGGSSGAGLRCCSSRFGGTLGGLGASVKPGEGTSASMRRMLLNN